MHLLQRTSRARIYISIAKAGQIDSGNNEVPRALGFFSARSHCDVLTRKHPEQATPDAVLQETTGFCGCWLRQLYPGISRMADDPATTEDAAAMQTEEAAPKAPAPVFPHPDAAKKAEQAATQASAHTDANAKAANVRQYLEQTVVPLLLQGMQELAKERPEDPVEYLAAYMLKHNPKKKQAA
eukprot:TRINITY_DN6707_c0_g2_i1.p2 TRINITY_DN6707_c0_g2~~TRINITY_DN6707_c0_g2_i1.p2  ORF type:complete len:183 (+),score=22.19 TRINITY_DN6707_c0_g2_i1:161-709(+)